MQRKETNEEKILTDLKNKLEKEFKDCTCHIVKNEPENIFDDINKLFAKQWKINYVESYNQRSHWPDESLDDWKVFKAIEAYKLGLCTKKSMCAEIMKIYGPWDLITRSVKYGQVEASLKCHICDFWDSCEEKCGMDPNSWKDYSPIELPK